MSIQTTVRSVFITSAVLISEAAAQVSGPILTYARHGEVLRAIIGVPGAAYFTPAIETSDVQLAAVSPESEYALTLNSDRTEVRILRLRGGKGATSATVAAFDSPVVSVHLSPRGTSAAVVRGDMIDIIAGLPENPKITTSTPTACKAVAVADDGNALLVIDNSQHLWLIKGEAKSQVPAIGVRDVVFRSGRHDFLYSDASFVVAVSGNVHTSIAGPPDGISAPQLARPSRDGRYTFIVNGTGDELIVHDQAGGILGRTSLPCIASEAGWLDDSTASVSCTRDSSIHFVQVTHNGVRLLFVPEPVE
jgi:hypothetical protein